MRPDTRILYSELDNKVARLNALGYVVIGTFALIGLFKNLSLSSQDAATDFIVVVAATALIGEQMYKRFSDKPIHANEMQLVRGNNALFFAYENPNALHKSFLKSAAAVAGVVIAVEELLLNDNAYMRMAMIVLAAVCKTYLCDAYQANWGAKKTR